MDVQFISYLILLIAIYAMGVIMHESTHYFLGKLFGGNPSFCRYWWRIPTRVDFRTPHQMSNLQVRLAGGGVLVFPIILIFGVFTGHIPTIFFGFGGSIISMTDMMGFQYPETWKEFTAGESISRDDID